MIQAELTESLIQRLKQQGFTVTVDHYLKMEALLKAAGPECPAEELKYLLCPVFAVNPNQQTRFYQTFDQCFPHSASKQKQEERRVEPDPTQKAQQARRWPYFAAGIVLALIVFVSVYFIFNQKQDGTGGAPDTEMPGGKHTPVVPETPVQQPEPVQPVKPEKRLTFY